MPLGQPTLLCRLQGIPTLDDSTTKGHYTNFNLVFKVSIRVCNSTSNCYHGYICEEKLWLHSFFEGYEIYRACRRIPLEVIQASIPSCWLCIHSLFGFRS